MDPLIALIRLARSHFLIKIPVLLFTTAFFQFAFLPWPAAYMTNLFRCTLATLALQTAIAIPSVFVFKSEKLYDLVGLGNFIVVCAISLGSTYSKELGLPGWGVVWDAVREGGVLEGARVVRGVWQGVDLRSVPADWSQWVVNGIITVWALRVGIYTFVRSILRGGDSRFDVVRENPKRFLMAFGMQALWVWFCTLPVVAFNTLTPNAFRGMECKPYGAEVFMFPTCYLRLMWFMLGVWSFVRGSAIELIADWQLSKWMWDRKQKKHDEVFCSRGLWESCRHPNYYGEILVWLGISICCSAFLLTTSARNELNLGRVTLANLCFIAGFFHYQVLKHVSLPIIEQKFDRLYIYTNKKYQVWRRHRTFRLWLDS